METENKKDPKREAWENLNRLPDLPIPGQPYEHYKGGYYVIVAVAIREDTLVPVVIYRSDLYGTVMERTLYNFKESVQTEKGMRPRFQRANFKGLI